jgi:hypothetical protein
MEFLPLVTEDFAVGEDENSIVGVGETNLVHSLPGKKFDAFKKRSFFSLASIYYMKIVCKY